MASRARPSARLLRCISLLSLMAASLGACTGGAGLGERCAGNGDCDSSLQCVSGVCTPRCTSHAECGDGFVCSETGLCEIVQSQLGDPCSRELDCGPGQACRLASAPGPDDTLAARCAADQSGASTGAPCVSDIDCRNGTCSIGRCTELCTAQGDCPSNMACVDMPRLLADTAPLFSGCLAASGTLETTIPVQVVAETLRVPVPSNARSFAMIARVEDEQQIVGATRVVAPAGRELYLRPFSPGEYYANPLRYAPAAGISTLIVPNTPSIEMETGVYTIDVASSSPAGGVGTAVPDITIVYRLDDAPRLPLNFYFANLEEHPCETQLGGVLDAGSAPDNLDFQDRYVARIEEIFAEAGILLGTITYRDLDRGRGDLDGIETSDLPTLLAQSVPGPGVNVFIVRSIAPAGIQALAGGTPGPPGLGGTRASGIAVAADTRCFRSWESLARLTAHQIGRHLGLFRNREPDGALDPITDSGDTPDNLMYFSEFGGSELSPGQSQVLRLYPGLQ